MSETGKGIAVLGNLIVDHIKMIDAYPAPGMLANICAQSRSVGGCAANTSVGLKRLDPSFRVVCAGMTGDDEDGRYIVSVLRKNGVDTSQVRVNGALKTSFTDVMTVEGTGERTFFHARGANAAFSYGDIDFEALRAEIFHIGYALLLDGFDAPDEAYGTVMSKTLAKARELGCKTSMDAVSESSGRMSAIIAPALKHCDYLIVNEIEASMICGIPARDGGGKILGENMRRICAALMGLGVRERAEQLQAYSACLWPRGRLRHTLGQYASTSDLKTQDSCVPPMLPQKVSRHPCYFILVYFFGRVFAAFSIQRSA